MSMFETVLRTNMLVEYLLEDGKTRTLRILWIDPEGDSLVTIDIQRENKHALPFFQTREEVESALERGQARLPGTDPWALLLRLNDKLSEEQIKKRQTRRDRAWAAIEPLVREHRLSLFDPRQRGPLITAQARSEHTLEEDEHQINKQRERKGFIYDALRRYWQGGQTKNALLPFFDECGGPGKEREGKERKLGRPSALARKEETPAGVILTNEVRRKLLRGYKTYYVSGKERTLEKAHQRTLETFFHTGFDEKGRPLLLAADQLPSLRQFTYIHEKYQDLTHLLISREGERRFALRHRATLGTSTQMAFGPGSLYQGDATIGDIHLVSSRDRSRLIGRPVIYVIIDVFTRLIAGFSVSLEGPSWVGMMLALYNATIDKVAYCQEYEIEITPEMWPSRGLPEAILGDRGELEGYNSSNLVDFLDIDVANTPPYRCDWKGIVEQNFRLMNDEVIHWKPGAVYAKRERGDKDYRLEACLTLPELRKLLILCILKHNNHHRMDWYNMDEFSITDPIEPYPVDLWNWGMTHRVGHLRDKPPEIIKLNLLPTSTASVTSSGICFQGVYYTCERALSEQWFVKARNRGRWQIPIAYDPRHLDLIYLVLDRHAQPELCMLVERERAAYLGRDWFEILDSFELQKQAKEASLTRQYRAEAEFNTQVDTIVRAAKEEAAQALGSQSKAARLKDIRENRRHERDEERKNDAWHLGEEAKTPLESGMRRPADQLETEDQSYIPADQPLDEIRRRREEKWTIQQKKGETTHG